MDVLGAEKKKLPFFQDMGHIIIGTVPPVPDKDVFGARKALLPVNHSTEGQEFIFLMYGLNEGIGISMEGEVIKSIQVHAVEAFGGMAF